MRKGLTVLIPTRGRPQRFKEAVDSLLRTSKVAEVLAYLDNDDPTFEEYEFPPDRVWVMRGPRVRNSRALKAMLALVDTEHMMFGSDDIVFKTEDWDVKLMEAIPSDHLGLSFGDDEWKKAASHYCFHRKWYDLTGIYPDVFVHFGTDGYGIRVMETLDRKRIKYLPDVKIAHIHFRNGKVPMDKTYQEERESGDGRQALEDALKDNLPKDIEILKAYLGQ